MTSSLVDIQFAESIAVKQHCTLALEGISKDSPITLGADDSILPLQESTFVGLARERKVIQPPASPDREEASCSLNILDFQWVGFVALQRAQGLNRVLLRFFNPQLICALLCLGLFSFVVSFRTMTTTPHLLELRVIGAGLSKGFDPSLKEYALLTHSSQHLTGVAAKVNPSETSLLTFRTKSENRSVKTGAGLAEAIRLDQDVYPADVELEVQDTFRRTEYRLQVLKYGILPESVVFSGEHSNGRSFQRCVPWGYLSLNHEVRIPPGLKTMDIFINYDHFVIDLPAPKRAHDRFTNLYEENVNKEHCFQKQLKNKEVVKTQFSGAGCYSVVQPKWNSCAQTRADLTQKFLEQVKGAVHGDLCVQGEYLGDFDCKKLETSGSSQLSRKLTQKDSETPGPWWEDKQVELRLLLSVGSSQLVLLDSRSYTSRAQGIQLTTHPRDIMDLFKAYMMAGTTMVRHKNVWGSITDLFDRDFFGTLPDTKEADVAFILDDFPNLTSAEFLEIILVSHDMDCYIQGLKAEDGEELQLTKTNSAFCHDHASGPTSDSEACDGWQPTSSFALPVSAFKDKMRKAIAYSDWNSDYAVRRLVFKGHPVCTSLSTFEEEIPLGNIFISIELSLKPQIKPIAWMPGQKVQADTYPCKTSCDVEILNGDALRPSGLELFITIVNEEANCTMQDFKTKANQRIVNKSKISEEACSQLDILSSTKMCGGKFESTTIALSWVSDSEAVTWNNDRSLMKQKIKFNLTCSDRIWNPFPLLVDVNSYPDADVGKFLFKG